MTKQNYGSQSSQNINQTMPNIKPYIIYLPRFFSFCLILGGKWPFFSYQVVIAVLFLQVKTKNGILCGSREMAETTEGNQWKGVLV